MSADEVEHLRRRERLLEAENAALRLQLVARSFPAAAPGGPGPLPARRSTRADAEALAATVEKTRTPMVLTDPNLPDNPIIFANRAFQEMTGYAPEELLGRNCRFLQGPNTDPAALEQMRAAIRERRDLVIDLVNYRKDGSSFINELYISPVFGADGELRYFFGCQTDATRHRNTARQLALSEDRWRRRFERLHEGFLLGEVLRDEQGRIVDWRCLEVNDAWEQLTGLSRDAVVGRSGSEALRVLDAEWTADFFHVAATGSQRSVTRWVRPLNLAFDARIFSPEQDQFAILVQDVTARLREEARREVLLELSELIRQDLDPDELAYRAAALLGQALGVSRAGYGTIDPVAETITIARDWNAPGIKTIAGILQFREHGSYIDDLKRGVTVAIADSRTDPRTAATTKVLEAISARAFVNMPVTEAEDFVALLYLNHAAAREWPEEELALIREVAERTRVAVERRRVEQELQALTASLEAQVEARTRELMLAEEQLRQSQKMEAVGQLTGGIAHDFNNLLTGITGSLELISTRAAQGHFNDIDRYVTAAQGAAKRAAALTHRLLAFSRRQTLAPKPTNVNALVVGMEEIIRRTVGPGITMEVVGAVGLWPALVDPHQLENALLNLCINARDAMPNGGRLTIETANTWLDATAGRQRELPPGQYVALCVSDTGTGMTPEVIARAFDPFFTTKPLGQGTGLGLSMIYGFVRQSGGQVRIYSEVGQGTTMRLYLPRHHGEVEAGEGNAAPPPSPRARQGETVLVIDDEPTVRMLVTEVLQELGYDAIEAGDGASGLKVLRSGTRIDLLITDVGLPGGMNGRQVADAARLIRPELKVLFITGYAENAAIGHGHLAPGMHVLTKPFAMQTLANRIRELIGGAAQG